MYLYIVAKLKRWLKIDLTEKKNTHLKQVSGNGYLHYMSRPRNLLSAEMCENSGFLSCQA